MEREKNLYHFRVRLKRWKSEFLRRQDVACLKMLCVLRKEFLQTIKTELEKTEFFTNSPDIYLQMQRKKFKKILNFKDYEQKN